MTIIPVERQWLENLKRQTALDVDRIYRNVATMLGSGPKPGPS